MSQLNTLKLKRVIFNLTGILFDSALIFLSGYVVYLIMSDTTKIVGGAFWVVSALLFILFILLSVVFAGVLEIISEKVVGERNTLFTSAPFNMTAEYKYIYDSNTGYYLGIIDRSNDSLTLKVYRQGFFVATELFDVNLIHCHSEDDIKTRVKANFEELQRIEKQVAIANKKHKSHKYPAQHDNFKKWDGYVDKQSRRDGILDKILK
jgi:hypothetical protein